VFAPLADEPFRFAPELRFAFPYGDCGMVRGAQNLPIYRKQGCWEACCVTGRALPVPVSDKLKWACI
jgi:hypothetical protein